MMSLEAGSAMCDPGKNWQRPIPLGAATLLLILIVGAGLVWMCGLGGLQDKDGLGAVPHLPAWTGKYYVDAMLDAESAVVLDPDTRHIIYAKRMRAKMYPASTTKILTALVAIENSKPGDMVMVGPEIRLAPRDGSKAGLHEGEKICMKDLLYGLMLPSGNDVAYVIAAHIAKKELGRNRRTRSLIACFVGLMNHRAKAAGADMSHFANPDGYHDPHHFATAYDLALIAREAMKQELFREIVKCPSYPRFRQSGSSVRQGPRGRVFPVNGRQTGKHGLPDQPLYLWKNRNLLLNSGSRFYVPAANGIKTGHTHEAGFCLVASASHQEKHMITVVLKATSTGVWSDATMLLAYGFHRTGKYPQLQRVAVRTIKLNKTDF